MAWDVGTAVYDNKSKYIGDEESSPSCVFFSLNGTKMYIVGITNDTVYQYTLSTSWDISTAVYADKYKSVGDESSQPNGLYFKADGTKMYIVGRTNDAVYQYTISTPWDISTAVYADKLKDLSSDFPYIAPYDIFFNPNGDKMYVTEDNNPRVYQYSLSTPWDVSTATYDSKYKYTGDEESRPCGLFIKSDGTIMYIVGTTQNDVFQYDILTPWDISTAVYADKYKSVSSEETFSHGLFLNSNGDKMYIVGRAQDTVFQYSLADIVLTTLAPNLVEDGIANLKLNLEDMAGLTIDSVGYYCDENATPSTEYIETGWRADIETGIYSIYVKTLPAGQTTLYVQAWADDSDGNRYTGSIISFDIPSKPEYTNLPDIIFPELPEIPEIEIDLPDINYNIGLDLYLDRTYTRKDLEELRQKCINYEKNYTDFCLILNHNTLLVKNFLQSAYNNGVLGGENEMFAKIYPSQQLTPLYLEPLEPDDFKEIINRFINNNTSNSMGLNHNFDLFKEWLNDYNYTSDGYKASYITPKEEIITNNEPTVKYLTGKINRLQREVSTSSREIMHNFNLIKEIIQ